MPRTFIITQHSPRKFTVELLDGADDAPSDFDIEAEGDEVSSTRTLSSLVQGDSDLAQWIARAS